MRMQHSPDLILHRMKYIPKSIRILTGKLEMLLRSSANYRERIKFLNYALVESLPELLPPKKTDLKDNIIWQYWDTGAVNAPVLIRVCLYTPPILLTTLRFSFLKGDFSRINLQMRLMADRHCSQPLLFC